MEIRLAEESSACCGVNLAFAGFGFGFLGLRFGVWGLGFGVFEVLRVLGLVLGLGLG
jgi:hypothetical protein